MVIWDDLYTVHGGFVNWTAEVLGIYSFTNELWSSSQYYINLGQERARSMEAYQQRQADRLLFDDYVEMGVQYKEWKKFNHPVYGEIEIGGWSRETGRVPPLFMLEELCHRNAMFTLFHADQMPSPSIDEVEVDHLQDNTYRVDVKVRNDRVMPTISTLAADKGVVRPDILALEGRSAEVVSAGRVENPWYRRVSDIPGRPERVLIKDGIPGNGTLTYQFIVKGSGKVNVTLDCLRGGRDAEEVRLK